MNSTACERSEEIGCRDVNSCVDVLHGMNEIEGMEGIEAIDEDDSR
jgi:hypothetical protein